MNPDRPTEKSVSPTVAIVDGDTSSLADKLSATLRSSRFWELLSQATGGHPAETLKVVILPELAGFEPRSPLATDPALVEMLIDLLGEHGFLDVSVVGSTDSSALWAGNRDIYAVCDLLGYRFETPKGLSYKVFDLSEVVESSPFSLESTLHGTRLSRIWTDAAFRLVFSKNRTDEDAGYALCLDTLLGVLPMADKDLYYRRRRDVGEVVADLLSVAPPHFALIDAITSAHGSGGKRAPNAHSTGTLIASSEIALADFVGALKMGLDPHISPIFNRVVQRYPLPQRYRIDGPLGGYAGWRNVPAVLVRSSRNRAGAAALDRLVQPWLQRLDPELFPFKNPLDAQLNSIVAPFFQDTDTSSASHWLLVLANLVIGALGQMLEASRVLFDKDALRQRPVSLGIDPAAYPQEIFDALVDEMTQLERIAANAAEEIGGLRWRYVDKAVVFAYTRTLPINFDLFTARVDVAHTIQFMNDYIGGVVVPLAHDEKGRSIRQAERNIYLPQPNYLVLYHGKYIDVTKLEVVKYEDNCHQLFWKTIRSENESATFDDGIARFERTDDGVKITITGRQLFSLPLFWQVFDLNLIPELKAALITDAYRTFFDRTIANFEALIEGREIRIGRPADEPSMPEGERLNELLAQIGTLFAPIIQSWLEGAAVPEGIKGRSEADEDGFVHVKPEDHRVSGASVAPPPAWIKEIQQFLAGLSDAARRDLARQAMKQ
jgi:uncharacterized protein (DUF362 family)